ncbi:uncharacterized protein BDZ99DRAFT_516956 [Mytilinidion resinicola]|uniref:Uncharacterized protein n=1 Tax=Mytilinidion resinicola TaxID=574789 RepID=A0A6A6Z2E9_9PEZI|nr:uncharacterized protein BDZ99DRAFT_516956 [Mytilinidion resinicola]KAF2814355.1 hypothetical protein BDZ99DRAFT_516956 [Mytilinidion resinicola]
MRRCLHAGFRQGIKSLLEMLVTSDLITYPTEDLPEIRWQNKASQPIFVHSSNYEQVLHNSGNAATDHSTASCELCKLFIKTLRPLDAPEEGPSVSVEVSWHESYHFVVRRADYSGGREIVIDESWEDCVPRKKSLAHPDSSSDILRKLLQHPQ